MANGNYGWDGPAWRAISTGSAIPATVVSGANFVNTRALMDVDRAEAQALKIPELRKDQPPVELLERLDPEYVGTYEIVQVIITNTLDYAIEFTTPRGKMRVTRRVHETWEECLIRMGLLDA